MIARLLARKMPVKLRVNVQARFLEQDRNSYNVLAELPGTDPALRDQVVMLGAHLDSWHTGTGATDNADGSAVVDGGVPHPQGAGRRSRSARCGSRCGAARSRACSGSRLGARAPRWRRQHSRAREARRSTSTSIRARGRSTAGISRTTTAAQPIFDAWLAPFKDLGGARKNVRRASATPITSSFIAAGVPGFNPIQDYVDYDVREHHTNADTAERIKEEDLQAERRSILASFIYHAANRAEMIPSADPPMMSRWVGVTIGLLAFVAGQRADGHALAVPRRRAGQPQFQAVRHERRWTSSCSRYAGKPLVVNLWATWCGPCRLEMPQLVALYQQYKDKGLTIVGISIDDSTRRRSARSRRSTASTTRLLVGAGRDDVLAAFGYFGAVPMSIFISADRADHRLRSRRRRPTATWERRIQELF